MRIRKKDIKKKKILNPKERRALNRIKRYYSGYFPQLVGQNREDYSYLSEGMCWPIGHPDYYLNMYHQQTGWCITYGWTEGGPYLFDYVIFLTATTFHLNNLPSQNPRSCFGGGCPARTGEDSLYPCTTNYFADTHPNDDECNYPQYCMNAQYESTGNCDILAILYEGKIVGWDNVNNLVSNSGPLNGVELYLRRYNGEVSISGYPEMGKQFDDLIIWKANNNKIYRLTQDSYNEVFNTTGNWNNPQGTWTDAGPVPISPNAYSIWSGPKDLYFEESDVQPQEPINPCYNCESINDYVPGPATACMDIGKEYGCNWRDDLGCYCTNSDAGCCPTIDTLPESTINQCRTDDDCRQGSVCIRNRCFLEELVIPPLDITPKPCYCNCITFNGTIYDEMYQDPSCGLCYITNNNYELGNWTEEEAGTNCTTWENCQWDCDENRLTK